MLCNKLRVLKSSVKALSLIREIRDEVCGPFLPIATCDFRPPLAMNSTLLTLAKDYLRRPHNHQYSATTCQIRMIAQTAPTITDDTSASPFLFAAI